NTQTSSSQNSPLTRPRTPSHTQTTTLTLTHLPTHPPTSIKASTQLRELLQSSSPSPILRKMSPRPRSSNYKSIAFRTPGAAARWREMMSARAAPQAPESSRVASPPTVSQSTESPSPIRQEPPKDERPKRKRRAPPPSRPSAAKRPRQTDKSTLRKAFCPPPHDMAERLFTFSDEDPAKERYYRLRSWPAFQQGYLDSQGFEDVHWLEPIREYCDRAGIWELVKVDGVVLPHATREFFSTLMIKPYATTSQLDAITFKLGGHPFHFSINDFGVALGIYTKEQLERGQLLGLATIDRHRITDQTAFWWEISTSREVYDASKSRASTMKKPMLRLLHLWARRSINGRRQESSGTVVNTRDLWLFHCLEKGIKVHLGDLVATLFRRVLEPTSSDILLGGAYVTRLVHNLGVFAAFGDPPSSLPGYPITVEGLISHGVSDLLDVECGARGDTSTDPTENFPRPTLDALTATVGNLQMVQGDLQACLQTFARETLQHFEDIWEMLIMLEQRIDHLAYSRE
ncbi:hypothetical protein LINGRAHAP2_LOCUS27850, partial [Linum grandiflorum]